MIVEFYNQHREWILSILSQAGDAFAFLGVFAVLRFLHLLLQKKRVVVIWKSKEVLESAKSEYRVSERLRAQYREMKLYRKLEKQCGERIISSMQIKFTEYDSCILKADGYRDIFGRLETDHGALWDSHFWRFYRGPDTHNYFGTKDIRKALIQAEIDPSPAMGATN